MITTAGTYIGYVETKKTKQDQKKKEEEKGKS